MRGEKGVKTMLMDTHKKEIIDYCIRNGLSIDAVFSAPLAYTAERVILLYFDPDGEIDDVIDETPAPIMLEIILENGKLRFVQTEHTYPYLAESELARMAYA
jgi:hypothetical protein